MKVKWYDDLVTAAVRRGAVRGLKAWAEDVLDESQELVPVAPDDVRGAGYIKETGRIDVDAPNLEAAVSYDSPPERSDGRRSTGSVVVVLHEDLDARHSGGRQAKFLEKPALGSKQSGRQAVAREIEMELR